MLWYKKLNWIYWHIKNYYFDFVKIPSCKNFVELSNNDWKVNWGNIDIPKSFSQHLKQCYIDGDNHLKEYSSEHIKKKLNYQLSKVVTKELLEDINAHTEIESWFQLIQQKIA